MKWHYFDAEPGDKTEEPSFWDYYPPPVWSRSYTESLSRALDAGLDPNAPWDASSPAGFFEDPQLMGSIPQVKLTNPHAWGRYNTPLHHIISGSEVELDAARLLLQRGADIDQLNSAGRTALHEAVIRQRVEAVEFLVEQGAGLNKRTVDAHTCVTEIEEDLIGRTGEYAWEYALWNSNTKILRMLLAAGADVRGKRWTALDVAIWAGDKRAVEVLLEFDQTLMEVPLAFRCSEEANLAPAARELLEVVNSKALTPPDKLYDAYCSALQQAVASTNSDLTAPVLVDAFTSSLKKMARVKPQQTRNPNLCTPCAIFQQEALKRWDLVERSTIDIPLHNDRTSLDRSADGGCPCCCIIADTLDFTGSVWYSADRQDPSPSVVLHCVYNPEKPFLNAPWVTCGELSAELEVHFAEGGWVDTISRLGRTDVDTGSENAMSIARHWLHSCRKLSAHEACRDAYQNTEGSESILPKRLLHVGVQDGADPRVVDTEGLSAKYAALSYCWGPSGFLTTTRANLPQHASFIPVDSLPQLLYDAVIVTRALELEYIWIDALCIIQDDPHDWAAEAARMHDIYTHAEVTISTFVSSDCRTSLFQTRKFRSKHPVPLDCWVPRSRREAGKPVQVIEPSRPGEESLPQGPVHTRAWTLQEQQMSTRILWFGDGSISWDCMDGVKTETKPKYSKRKTTSLIPAYHFDSFAVRAVLKGLMLKGAAKPWNFAEASPFKIWQLLLEEFSRRKITHESDRLPAFMSITSALAALGGGESAHGMWLGEKMIPSLCWRAKKPSEQRKSGEMPSWLWTGMKGEVLFDLERIIRTPQTGGFESASCVTVVSVDTSTNLALSQVTGSITIKGTLCKKTPLSTSILASQEVPSQKYKESGPGGKHIFLDEQVDSLENCYTMPVAWYPHCKEPGGEYPEWPELQAPPTIIMVLRKIGEGDRFRRVGIAVRYYYDTIFGVEKNGGMVGAQESIENAYEWLDWHEEVYDNQLVTLV